MKSSSARSKLLKIIIRLILFLIHMYLWGTYAVFLWRYPHISGRTNFEFGWLKRGLLMIKRCFLTCQEWALLSISSLTFRLDFQTIEMVFLSWIDRVFELATLCKERSDSMCSEWKHLSIQYATFIWICEWLGLYFSYDTTLFLIGTSLQLTQLV